MNILCSYAYFPSPSVFKFLEKHNVNLLLDSGAYTAFTQGKVVDVDKYIDYIRQCEPMKFESFKYIQLDVMGSQEKTLSNLKYMVKKGLKPIPVLQRGETTVLDTLFNYGETVAIGGLKSHKTNVDSYLKEVFTYAGDRNIHLLGHGNLKDIMHYKPASYDSLVWRIRTNFGELDVWDGITMHRITKKKFFSKGNASLKSKLLRAIKTLITTYKVDPSLCTIDHLYDLDNWNGNVTERINLILSTISWFKYSETLYKKNGTRFYMVCGSLDDINFLVKIKNNITIR